MRHSSSFLFNKYDLITTIVAIAALCDFLYYLPFFGEVFHQTYKTSLVLSVVAASVLLITFSQGDRIRPYKLLFTLWILAVSLTLYTTKLALGVWGLFAGLAVVQLLPSNLQKNTFEVFRTFFCWILVVNILAYPLITLGVLHSFESIIPTYIGKADTGVYYDNYFISFVERSLKENFTGSDGGLYRMSAWFEEPGNVGTISALLLSATGFKMDWKGRILLVGGGLSFSLAFYFLSALYAAMRKPKIFLLMLGVAILFFGVFQENEFVSKYVIDRVIVTDEGLSGDNRTGNELDLAFDNYLETPMVWWGHDAEHSITELGDYSSSWKNLVWDYGIFGTVMMLSIYILNFMRKLIENPQRLFFTLKNLLPFFIVFFLSIYQRPYVFTLSYFLIFVGAMVWHDSEAMLIEASSITMQNPGAEGFHRNMKSSA